MEYFAKGEFYPPIEHQERIKRYKENKKLFKGEHWDLFRKYNFNKNGGFYVSVNLAGIISKKSADFLIGDGVQVSAGKEDHSKEQQALDRIKEDNDLDILFYESALANSYRGDSFLKLRYGQEFGGDYGSDIDPYRVHIDSVSAEYVFPETSKFDDNKIVAFHIAIPVLNDPSVGGYSPNSYRLHVESHYAGRIVYREFQLSVLRSEADGTPVEWKIHQQLGETYEEQTGVPYPLVVHIPNYATEDTWQGLDDLSELKPLFDELNNRFSQISSIMDKHSDPALAVPPNLFVEDDYGRPMFNVADSKVFEVDKQDVIPQYITWNGQLTEAYTEIDKLVNLILTTAEIPEVALGMTDSGTSGSSGLAIKWRMNSLLTKIKRKRKYYEKGLKRVFMIAQMLEVVTGVADYSVTTPKLVFTDGLPKDDLEQTTIALQKTGGAILQSQKTAIMELSGLTEEQADAEITRIKEEQAELTASQPKADPSIFNEYAFDGDDGDVEEDEAVE